VVVDQVLQKKPGLPLLVGLFIDHYIPDADLATSKHFYMDGFIFHYATSVSENCRSAAGGSWLPSRQQPAGN